MTEVKLKSIAVDAIIGLSLAKAATGMGMEL